MIVKDLNLEIKKLNQEVLELRSALRVKEIDIDNLAQDCDLVKKRLLLYRKVVEDNKIDDSLLIQETPR